MRSTHEIWFVRDAVTRIVSIDHGKVVETGTPEAFCSQQQTDRARQVLLCYAATSQPARAPLEGHTHA